MKYDIAAALQALKPGAEWVLRGDKYSGLEWMDKKQTVPTEKEINDKIAELKNLEPMRLLREERNRKLAETDWMANSDVTMTDDWRIYRQSLRDLPSTAEPQLDENGQLTNVTWPTKPE